MATPRRRPDVNAQFRAVVDLAMGVLYILVSVYAYFNVGLQERLGKTTLLGLLIVFCLYGLYRVTKGVYFFVQLQKRKE